MRWILRTSVVSLIVALAAQIACAGDHSGSHSSAGTVHVNGYYRKDGTYVHSYDRAAPEYALILPQLRQVCTDRRGVHLISIGLCRDCLDIRTAIQT